jgi:hypothetical protein
MNTSTMAHFGRCASATALALNQPGVDASAAPGV